MKKVLLLLLVVLLAVAYYTKPDDKTCIIEGVRAVWGGYMPDMYERPAHFEEFMNVNSKSVVLKDLLFFKQIKYKLRAEEKTVAFGAFNKVFAVVEPLKTNNNIPTMPLPKKQ